jgi:hypothetical protein
MQFNFSALLQILENSILNKDSESVLVVGAPETGKKKVFIYKEVTPN